MSKDHHYELREPASCSWEESQSLYVLNSSVLKALPRHCMEGSAEGNLSAWVTLYSRTQCRGNAAAEPPLHFQLW